MKPHHWRLVGFVGTVAVISILANFSLELAATKYPQLGLCQFTNFTHGSTYAQGGN